MAERKTKITFELESETSVAVMRDGKQIGRLWSQTGNDTAILPYPHRDTPYCFNSVQICGFDKMSPIWPCGPFKGHKDCVVHFLPTDEEWHQDQLKKYQEYVKNFFDVGVKEIVLSDNSTFVPTVNTKRDFTELKSYSDWLQHAGLD